MKKERLTKRLALFTALTLTGAMLAGCGNTDAAESSSDAQTGVTADTQAAAGDASADVVYRTLDEIKESGTINIGVFSDKNPFGYVDENGEYQGYDVYFANRLAEDLGVDVNFVSTEAASRIEYLQTRTRVCADGRTDMVDQKAFIAETVFDEISNILCIFDAVAVADENDVILVTPAADLFFHGIHESNQRLFASSHFGERNQMSLIIHMKKWF